MRNLPRIAQLMVEVKDELALFTKILGDDSEDPQQLVDLNLRMHNTYLELNHLLLEEADARLGADPSVVSTRRLSDPW